MHQERDVSLNYRGFYSTYTFVSHQKMFINYPYTNSIPRMLPFLLLFELRVTKSIDRLHPCGPALGYVLCQHLQFIYYSSPGSLGGAHLRATFEVLVHS